ncbi:ankyrin-1-like [Ctenocephalides felis]|uniref:ankyrin-1-like n=1 Tax=Ctenocephalides felis TaxID=7515 RepID=UPI000E6E37D4|nr:ankyrin-1-like [Ctenocephalides felis]
MGQNTTLQYAEQMHFIYLFIKKIYKNNFENNYDVMSGILQLLIRDARRSSDVNNYELVIQTDVIMMYVGTKKIELFSMFYKLDAICDLSKYPAFHNVLSDNEYLRNFMKRVEYLHVVHGYCQKDAFDEACQQVARFEHIIRWILEQNSTKFQELDEVFAKLGFKNICIDKELEDLSSNINTFGIHFVNKIWSILIRVGPQKLSEVIKYLMTLLKQISKVYKLLKNLETSYDGLMDGIKNRNYKIVEYVLNCVEPDFVKSVIHGENMNCGSPLHYAASIGDANLCELLLRFGANVNLNSNIDNLVLKDHVETKGANIDIVSSESITTNISPKINPDIMNLKDSASSFASSDVEAAYVNIDNTSSEIITDLLKTQNSPEDVALMKNCINVKKKMTPLHCAVSNGHKEVVQILLKKFANVKSTNAMNETPLHIAALKGYEKIVEILLKAGAPIKVWDDNNMTPLHCAASNGHENVVRLLLENLTSAADNSSAESPTPHVGSGQKPKNWFTDRKHLTPLYYAAKNSHRNVVKILINEYSKKDCVKVKKSPALNLMLKRDISIVVCGENIATLFMAIINNEKEAVQILIDNGIAVNITNEQNWTPLHVASTVGHSELLQLLIDKAAEVNVATDLKITPLHLAAHYGYKKIIEILLLNGAEVNSVASNDLTPLVMAFCGNHLKLLISY